MENEQNITTINNFTKDIARNEKKYNNNEQIYETHSKITQDKERIYRKLEG